MELPSPTFAITATDTKDKEQFPNNDNMDRQIFHRFKENPIMVPSDIAPSAPGLKIECLLNPGVFRFRGRTCMLLRVAERPEQEPGSVSFPVYNDRAGKVEIMSIPRNSPDLKDDDARVIEYRGQNYLTTRSHLRLVFSDDGINFHEDPQYPPIMGYSAYTAYSIEDCRVTKIGDTYYLTYSAVSPMGVGVGMSSTEDWKTVTDHGLIFPPHNKDCAVFPEKVDGKYYAIPHYEIFDGINYDIDLFEKENLYFAENKDNGNNGFVLSAADVRSKGPDGQPGTWDDGLPASVDEFFALCDYMITRGIIPMIWSGQYPFYFASLMMAFSANYLSAEELMANFSFDSEGVETEVVTGFNAAGVPQIEKKVITPKNGNDVYAQAAKYYALDFMERIYSNPDYYYDKSTSSSVFSNTDAQDVFVKSKLKGGKEKPIAMLVDGNWWYNEAKTAIKESYSYGAAAYNRRFGYMPIPTAQTTAQAEAGKEMKLLNRYNSYVFIRATIDPNKISAAKEFLKFCYLPENLQQFTMDTGLHKAVEYTMTDEQLAQLPYETKQIMEYKIEHGSYDARSTSPIYIQNEGEILTASVVNGYGYDYPTDAFKNKVSAKDYFKGMWVGSDTWNAMYSKFFD